MTHMVDLESIQKVREACPDVAVVCYVNSTAQIKAASDCKEFIICTEMGIFYELQMKNPDKKFYSVGHRQFCPNMKRIKPASVLHALESLEPEVELEEEISVRARVPLQRMLELAK